MLKSHYSPNTPLEITSFDQLKQLINRKNQSAFAFIFQKQPDESFYQKSPNIYWLSENGENQEIAHNLYQLLRATDALNYQRIYIEDIKDTEGMSLAVKDRILKATSQ